MKYFSIKIAVALTFFANTSLCAQNTHKIIATLKEETKSINVQQEISFHNHSNDTLNALYLLDWNNAYANKNTALAERFAEEFDKSLHLAKNRERGFTKIISVADRNFKPLRWERLDVGDVLKIQLNFPIYPNQKFIIKLFYTIKLPNSKFTYYGYAEDGNFNLRYWYIIPALYRKKEGWTLYSNKNLDDLPSVPTDYTITLNYPAAYKISTDLDVVEENSISETRQTIVKGNNRADVKFFLEKQQSYAEYKTKTLTLISNIAVKDLSENDKIKSIEKVVDFIAENLGTYPHQKLIINEIDYKKNPLYGLNQLPSFLRPFPEDVQYQLKLLKTILNNYLENTIYIDLRAEKWVTDAIQTYLMIKYVETYYPAMKLIGNLSDFWLVKGFHLAQMNFNEQYPFLYTLMARKNIDQSLAASRDSLIKFNEKIANKYKAGLGLKYIDDYMGKNAVDSTIKIFYKNYSLKKPGAEDFETLLRKYSTKDIDWFFKEYVATRHKIDFKIKKIKEISEDSLSVIIKNKRNTNVPISLFGITNDTVVSKHWLTDIKDEKTIKIPKNNAERLVLNYDKIIPEFNQKNNWKSIKKGFLFYNKPLKFTFFKDAENPFYNQVFYVPILTYNLYDGLTPGLRLYNKNLIEQPFLYDIRPSYATKEKALVGGATVPYRHYIEEKNLYLINYYLNGSTFHYAENLKYSTVTPGISLGFRSFDFRSNERRFVTLRNINVFRDKNPEIITDPDYSVFDARYNYFNNNMINYFSWFTDVQIAEKFSKLSFNVEYRRLFRNNRQLNLRLFAGKFIHNKTNSDFFSFALDRPTDYLFDYDYLGRSENSGIYSQQLIITEGGFKSKLNDAFANDWMLTVNASINLWRWIEAYGDAGFVKNQNINTHFVYDSGIRLNLVTDYFELYFPLYSNNGWEIAQPNYNQKIRFIVTLSPKTLIGLFTRKWF